MKKIIGIMTGNSLDACDIVLTEFDGTKIRDLASYSLISPIQLRNDLLKLRQKINTQEIKMEELDNDPFFIQTHDAYIQWVATAVNTLLEENNIDKTQINAIGFHGQTMDHCPPSIASKNGVEPYTLQIGSGQVLADIVGIPVIYDFRSADLMAGGEGAPLVPPHNGHLAMNWGLTDAIFYNAGNTSNLAVISDSKTAQGFDAGPFNEFNDKLVRNYKKESCDEDGKYGLQGKLIPELLQKLFETAAVTATGDNFFDVVPPKSSDPKWYRYDSIEEFQNPTDFNDVLHTSEYFSGYVAAYALKHVRSNILMPTDFILFGGGWHNPVARKAFEDILSGIGYVLPHHQEIFKTIVSRFQGKKPQVQISDFGKYMEARLFADLARCYLENKTWSTPELTGCKIPTVLGVLATPAINTPPPPANLT